MGVPNQLSKYKILTIPTRQVITKKIPTKAVSIYSVIGSTLTE